jgi:hypothetical protein
MVLIDSPPYRLTWRGIAQQLKAIRAAAAPAGK